MAEIDAIDRKLLKALQRDASLSLADLSQRVSLSQNACWRRIKRLEADGVIDRRVALLNGEALGRSVTVFVFVRTSEHNEDWLGRFAEGVRQLPEVVEFHRMTGDIDYLLKIIVSEISDYDRVYKQLIRVAPLFSVSSSFSMERLKYTTEIPLDDGGR